MSKTRNILLFFLSLSGDRESFNLEDYYLVLNMPIKEFKSDDIKTMAEEILYFTTCADWFMRGRRHIEPRDVIYVNNRYYMFVNKSRSKEGGIVFDNPKIKLKLIEIGGITNKN